MTTRAKEGIHKPNTMYVLLTSRYNTEAPKTIASALKHPGWIASVSDEITTIHMLHTWTLVPQTSEMNVLVCRWLFTIKYNPDGGIRKFNSRLVAKGYDQEEGWDYLKTFSPVVRTSTIWMVLDVVVSKGWKIKQLDVTNAFLYEELDELMFMTQPPGFFDSETPHYVCRLTKALYGLKQAPRAWFKTISNYLIDYGFTCSKSDPSFFHISQQ